MSKTNAHANTMLDAEHGGSDYSQPATTYFQPVITTPTPSSAGTPHPGLGRLAYTNDVTNWPAASSQEKANGTLMDWGNASAGTSSDIVVDIEEWDASSGGNRLNFGLLSTPRVVLSGDPFTIPIGGLVFRIRPS